MTDRHPGEDPSPLMLSDEQLNDYLPVFLVEIRSQKGERYPEKTLYSLVVHINTARREHNHLLANIFTDAVFAPSKAMLDACMKSAKQDRIGNDVQVENRRKHSPLSEAEHLQIATTLDTTTPKGLIHCIFMMLGIQFALRGKRDTLRADHRPVFG
eukprot:gnl/Spiro4/26883_TR13370_c0_g2_i1.p2 gnl/Spiro4/26883_TR13370_c0_g2~~gnl/Spiro4/26883_TR13370_c0_g2_i1.p2  ORF type:complete len:156 (+),score=23.13 gnl/Spiro4/26883_TR13370_c0_g2_i1:246-713(+)